MVDEFVMDLLMKTFSGKYRLELEFCCRGDEKLWDAFLKWGEKGFESSLKAFDPKCSLKSSQKVRKSSWKARKYYWNDWIHIKFLWKLLKFLE